MTETTVEQKKYWRKKDKENKCVLIKGVCWRKDYVRISNFNFLMILTSMIFGLVMTIGSFTFWSENYAYIIPFGSALIFTSSMQFFFSKYSFLNHKWALRKNPYIQEAISMFSFKYNRFFKWKYFASVIYQIGMIVPFFYTIFASTTGEPMNWMVTGIIIAFYLSWFALIFVDYLNSFDSRDPKFDKVKFKIVKKSLGFVLFAFFWAFMITPEDFVVYDLANPEIKPLEPSDSDERKTFRSKITKKNKKK